MSKRQTLRALVNERLTAAAEEIFALVEGAMAEFEEELCRCREENQRKQQLLQELLTTDRTDSAPRGDKEVERPSLKPENLESCAQWKQQHFYSVPPNVNTAKEGPAISLVSQEYLRPGEHESVSSDAENTDDEPSIDEANQNQDFYEQTEMGTDQNLDSDSSNLTRKFSRPPKQCAICGKVYGDLKRHMTVHTGEKPYSCTVCGKKFTRKGSLQSHMAVHRGDTPFICPVCGKMFSQRGHLQTHALMHSGEKPFSCTVCNVKFSSKALLIRHRRVHTGVKPFSCPFCERGFTRNEHLRRHVQTHTGALPEMFSFPLAPLSIHSAAQSLTAEQREEEATAVASLVSHNAPMSECSYVHRNQEREKVCFDVELKEDKGTEGKVQ